MVKDRLAFDRGMARGVAAFRWAALTWAWVGLVLERDELERQWLAIAALLAAWAITVVATGFATRRSEAVFVPSFVVPTATPGAIEPSTLASNVLNTRAASMPSDSAATSP